MRHSASLILLVVFWFFAHLPRAQEQPKPSQPPAPVPPVAGQTPEASPQAAPNATGSAKPTNIILYEGTAVKLKLLHSLNSKTVVVDDPLNFSVAEDVVVNGKTVVKAGAVSIGRVRKAKPARTLGRGAELALDMQYMRVGRIRVPLRGSQARRGEGKKGDVVALVVVFGLSGLIKHGSEIEVKEGSIFTAYVDQDTNLPPESEASGEGP